MEEIWNKKWERKFQGNYHVDEHKILSLKKGKSKISRTSMDVKTTKFVSFDVYCGLSGAMLKGI